MIIAISGTSQGLGMELAGYFKKKGHTIIGFGIPAFDDFTQEARQAVDKYLYADMTNPEEVLRLAETLEAEKPDAVIFNAAVKDFDSVEKFTPERINRLLQVNLNANFILTSSLVNGMLERGFGRLIYIASKSSYYGYSSGSLYTASKGALFQYTQSIAKDIRRTGKNVTANTLAPDAFYSREGVKAASYGYIVQSCAESIEGLLKTNKSGEIIPIVGTKERLIISAKQIISGIKLLFTK